MRSMLLVLGLAACAKDVPAPITTDAAPPTGHEAAAALSQLTATCTRGESEAHVARLREAVLRNDADVIGTEVQWFDAWLAAQGLATREVRGAFKGRGGLNGGTVASLMGGLDHLDALRDPVLLNPPEARGLALAPDETRARFDEALGIWVSPFVMSVVNSRVVRRSAALCAQRGLAYGPAFDLSLIHI